MQQGPGTDDLRLLKSVDKAKIVQERALSHDARCTKTWAVGQYANCYNAYSFAHLQWSSYMSYVLEDSASPLYGVRQNTLMI